MAAQQPNVFYHRRLVIFLIMFAVFFFARVDVRSATATWTDPNEPVVVQKFKDFTGDINASQFGFGVDCEQDTVKVNDVLDIIPTIHDSYINDCVVSMSFGGITKSGLVLINGLAEANPIPYHNFLLLPVPHTNTVFMLDNAGFGGGVYNLRKIDDFSGATRLGLANHLDGSGFYGLFYAASSPVLDNSSRQLLSSGGVIALSKNNQWLLTSSNGILYRVNVSGSEQPKTITEGEAPQGYSAHAAISNDGRFVALSTAWAAPTIYDVEKCSPQTQDAASGCRKDLYSDLYSEIGSGAWVYRMNFVQNGATSRLKLWLTKHTDQDRKIQIYNVFPDASSRDYYNSGQSNVRYMAMGDSFASGEGTFDYVFGTDYRNNRCHLGLQAYDQLVTQSLSIVDHRSVACSGAKMRDVLYSWDEKEFIILNGPLGTPTKDQYYNSDYRQSQGKSDDIYSSEIYSQYLPGYRQQIRFVERYQPNVITVSLSGNDIGFSEKLINCLLPGKCYQSKTDRTAIYLEILSKFKQLSDTLSAIKQKAPEDAKIYVMGYPHLFADAGRYDCGLNTPFASEEIDLANDLVDDLNSMIKTASQKTGVSFIDNTLTMQSALLCGGNDDTHVAFNGITAGNDAVKYIGYPLGKESFHPNKIGHQLYANALIEQSNSFSVPNPDPMPHLTSASVPSSALVAGGNDSTPIDFDMVALQQKEDGLAEGEEMIFLSNDGRFYVSVINSLVKPSQVYVVSIHSDPTELGTLVSDQDGVLSGNFTLPAGFEPGFHTLHLIGPSSQGHVVDFYKIVYVAYSDSDYDGDGILNENEACLTGVASGIDKDGDNIDDACDPFYTAARPTVLSTASSSHDDDYEQAEEQQAIQPSHSDGVARVNPTSVSATQTLAQQTTATRLPMTVGLYIAAATAHHIGTTIIVATLIVAGLAAGAVLFKIRTRT